MTRRGSVPPRSINHLNYKLCKLLIGCPQASLITDRVILITGVYVALATAVCCPKFGEEGTDARAGIITLRSCKYLDVSRASRSQSAASESRLRVSLTVNLASNPTAPDMGLVRNCRRASEMQSKHRILIVTVILSCQHVSELWPIEAEATTILCSKRVVMGDPRFPCHWPPIALS